MNETVIQNPKIIWLNASNPREKPQADPPPWDAGTWEITGSEIRIRPSGAVVSIWVAAIPAVPA